MSDSEKNNRTLSKIPVTFQKIREYKSNDTRFTKVKIWLMHIGENYNGSYFTKEVVEEAIPSLANTPILGHIEPNGKNEDDFSDHRSVIYKNEKGEIEYKYLGRAYGLIPENNNAKFETKVCDDGIERTFLTVEGLLWNKWSESIDIMNRDFIKSQSMELDENYEGYVNDKDGLFYFTKIMFFGACFLGFDYEPAMESATIELNLNYSLENIVKELNKKVEEFKKIELDMKNKDEEGSEKMDEALKKLLEKYNKTQEDVEKMGINLEVVSFEVLEKVLKPEDAQYKEEDEDKEDKEDKKDSVSLDSYNDLDEKYNDLLEKHKALEKEKDELQTFKNEKLAKEREEEEDALFDKYKMLDGNSDFEKLKETSNNFETVLDLEKEIALIFVNNTTLNFNKEDKKSSDSRYDFVPNDDKTDDNVVYADLIKKYSK